MDRRLRDHCWLWLCATSAQCCMGFQLWPINRAKIEKMNAQNHNGRKHYQRGRGAQINLFFECIYIIAFLYERVDFIIWLLGRFIQLFDLTPKLFNLDLRSSFSCLSCSSSDDAFSSAPKFLARGL